MDVAGISEVFLFCALRIPVLKHIGFEGLDPSNTGVGSENEMEDPDSDSPAKRRKSVKHKRLGSIERSRSGTAHKAPFMAGAAMHQGAQVVS